MAIVSETLKSQSFLEKFFLLIATGALTGLLIPIVTSYMQDLRQKEQKRHEAELARQTKIIQSQSDFLDRVTDQILDYEFLAFQVSYYKDHTDEERYKTAYKQYDEKALSYFNGTRKEIDKAKRLLSPNAYEMILKISDEMMPAIDGRLVRLVEEKADDAKWKEFDQWLRVKVLEDTQNAIDGLAAELGLSTSRSKPN